MQTTFARNCSKFHSFFFLVLTYNSCLIQQFTWEQLYPKPSKTNHEVLFGSVKYIWNALSFFIISFTISGFFFNFICATLNERPTGSAFMSLVLFIYIHWLGFTFSFAQAAAAAQAGASVIQIFVGRLRVFFRPSVSWL